jgi:hypothetical protein
MPKLITAEAAMLSNRGRCPGCGSLGSWDTPISGTCGLANTPCKWASCSQHKQALGAPVDSAGYRLVHAVAAKCNETVDAYLARRRWELPHGRATALEAARAAHPEAISADTLPEHVRQETRFDPPAWSVPIFYYGNVNEPEVGQVVVVVDAEGEVTCHLWSRV